MDVQSEMIEVQTPGGRDAGASSRVPAARRRAAGRDRGAGGLRAERRTSRTWRAGSPAEGYVDAGPGPVLPRRHGARRRLRRAARGDPPDERAAPTTGSSRTSAAPIASLQTAAGRARRPHRHHRLLHGRPRQLPHRLRAARQDHGGRRRSTAAASRSIGRPTLDGARAGVLRRAGPLHPARPGRGAARPRPQRLGKPVEVIVYPRRRTASSATSATRIGRTPPRTPGSA